MTKLSLIYSIWVTSLKLALSLFWYGEVCIKHAHVMVVWVFVLFVCMVTLSSNWQNPAVSSIVMEVIQQLQHCFYLMKFITEFITVRH